MKKIRIVSAPFILLLFLIGCDTGNSIKSPAVPATLIYMVADNNLDYYAMQNIRQMERGLPDDAAGPIFVFITRRASANPSHPYLLKITQNITDDPIIRSPIIQTYRQQNSCDPLFMRRVIADVKNHCRIYNAELSRLVLWSHGSGWLPEGTPFDEIDDDETKTSKNGIGTPHFSFGLDETGNGDGTEYKREMCIKDLAWALEGERFELIVMDACFMGTIETAYELRNVSDYLIMSPAEIIATGFPYEEIIGFLAATTLEPLAIAIKHFYHYYNKTGALQTAAISVINTRHLEDLADAMNPVYLDYLQYMSNINTKDIFQYDRTMSNYFFDFKLFLVLLSSFTGNNYLNVLGIYNRVLPYYLHTPKIFDTLELVGTGGLSIYIPNMFETRSELHEYYQSLSWTQDSNAISLFE